MSNITPPPELVQKWLGDFFGCTPDPELSDAERFLATRAAQYGADQELKLCCEWLKRWDGSNSYSTPMRAARRPKPPSLKQQALDLLKTDLEPGQEVASITLPAKSIDTIRRALEALPDE